MTVLDDDARQDVMKDPEYCGAFHGSENFAPCFSKAEAWYWIPGVNYLIVSRCRKHRAFDPSFIPVTKDEAVTAWVMKM